MNRQITCIVCPRGCVMTADLTGDTIQVTGNACPRGEQHAIGECTNPVRTVTACVRVSNRENTMVSVKTDAPVPKDKMMDVIAALHKVAVEAPAAIGDVVISDIFGANVIVTKNVM